MALIIKLPVVFTVVGSNLAVIVLKDPGFRVTVAEESFAETSIPMCPTKGEVVIAGDGFLTPLTITLTF
jgi:hypothetical protein